MIVRTNKKTLASKLNNRVEVWGKEIIQSEYGDDYTDKFLKKMWCDIIPLSGKINNESGDTISNDTNFKIRARKQGIKTDNWIIFEGLRYDIKYILPDFNTNKFIEIFAVLNTE
jgi:head-tail adaptor